MFCELLSLLVKLTLILMAHIIKENYFFNSVKFALKINLKNHI